MVADLTSSSMVWLFITADLARVGRDLGCRMQHGLIRNGSSCFGLVVNLAPINHLILMMFSKHCTDSVTSPQCPVEGFVQFAPKLMAPMATFMTICCVDKTSSLL